MNGDAGQEGAFDSTFGTLRSGSFLFRRRDVNEAHIMRSNGYDYGLNYGDRSSRPLRRTVSLQGGNAPGIHWEVILLDWTMQGSSAPPSQFDPYHWNPHIWFWNSAF